jgi:regulatory LuxR family protein
MSVEERDVATRDVDDPFEELTHREREVLALMTEEQSNAGIGRRLWLTKGTVSGGGSSPTPLSYTIYGVEEVLKLGSSSARATKY